MARKYVRRRECPQELRVYEPSADEIRKAAQEVQARWSSEVEAKRRIVPGVPWTPPEFNIAFIHKRGQQQLPTD